jgi:hypothetical protein
MVSKRKISDYIGIVADTAQTSHYELSFDGLSGGLSRFLASKGVDKDFILRNAGLLCSDAVLPGSQLQVFGDTYSDFTGVTERFAGQRIFSDTNLQFYVDKEYKMLKFMEHWIDYITNGSEITGINKDQEGYFYRMRYPRERTDGYKCDRIKIVKFDRDYKNQIEYTFFGMFPRIIDSTPVRYGDSQTLKISVLFSYERYICGKVTSLSRSIGSNENFLRSLLP